MKSTNLIVFVLLALSFSPFLLSAQEYNEDMDSISKVYARMKEFSMEMEYNLYQDYKSKRSVEKETALYKKEGENYYNKFFDLETLINDKYIIVLSHDNKLLMIDQSKKKQSAHASRSKNLLLDSIFTRLIKEVRKEKKGEPSVTVQEKNINDTQKEFILGYKSGEFTAVHYTFNKQTYLLDKVELYYRKKIKMKEDGVEASPRIELVYKKWDTHPDFRMETFSENQYVTILEGGKLKVNPAFSNYKIVNHLVKN